MIRRAVLVFSFACSALACAAQPVNTNFEDALRAARDNDWETLARLEPRIARDYPLRDYLEFHHLRRDLPELNPSRLRDYENRYPRSPLPADIRQIALIAYAKAGRWDAAAEAMDNPPTAIEARCYYQRAQLRHDRDAALQDAREIWLAGQSRPSACDPLFEAAQAAGVIGQEEIWQRMQLAFEARATGLMRYLKRMLDAPYQTAGEWLEQLYHNPDKVGDLPATLPSARRQELVSAALQRMAYTNTSGARQAFEQRARRWGLTDPELRDAAGDRIAFYSTIRGVRENQDWLDRWLSDHPDTALLDQRIRRAIIEQDWPAVTRWIQQLPAEEAADSRWRYWAGRAAWENGQRHQATPLWQQAAEQRNFYGFLAADRLGQTYSFNQQGYQPDANITLPPGVIRVRLLRDMGEYGSAWKEWHWLMLHNDRPHQDRLAQYALEQGWYDLTVQASIQAKAWDTLAWRFPAAYSQEFARASARHKLDPWLAMAISRRESAFNPRAQSHAGAMGLMQLMPGTARKVALDEEQPAPSRDQVFDPQTNINLGSRYLSDMLGRFNGNRILALAAYNAGPGRIPQWLPAPGDTRPMDVWIESIPFRETREYVQAVLTYRVLLAGLHAPDEKVHLTTPAERNADYSQALLQSDEALVRK